MANPLQILLVEAAPTPRGAAFAEAELQVLRAASATEAIALLVDHAVDAIVVELALPAESGLAVLTHVREKPAPPAAPAPTPAASAGRFLPVLVLADLAEPAARAALFDAGADDLLPCAVAPQELLARVRRLAARRAAVDLLLDEAATLRELSITDGLTGAANHRYFHERLADEFRRALRYDDSLALIILDIDHFKNVNDRHGHQVGDLVLKAVAGCVKGAVRETDFVARYGGEEFGVLLPKTHLAGALTVAERISTDLRALRFEGGVRVTASFGVSGFPGRSVHTPEQLVRTADQALYRAKSEGRNKITLYAPALFTPASPGSV